MDKKLFDDLVESIKLAGKHKRGKAKPSRIFVHKEPDVKAIRGAARLSQAQFSSLIGVSKRTVENWEQGRNRPTGPARALLRILANDPQRSINALHNEAA